MRLVARVRLVGRMRLVISHSKLTGHATREHELIRSRLCGRIGRCYRRRRGCLRWNRRVAEQCGNRDGEWSQKLALFHGKVPNRLTTPNYTLSCGTSIKGILPGAEITHGGFCFSAPLWKLVIEMIVQFRGFEFGKPTAAAECVGFRVEPPIRLRA
jgi:hypothetical protein